MKAYVINGNLLSTDKVLHIVNDIIDPPNEDVEMVFGPKEAYNELQDRVDYDYMMRINQSEESNKNIPLGAKLDNSEAGLITADQFDNFMSTYKSSTDNDTYDCYEDDYECDDEEFD